ncbi:MAG: hypothetical protein H0U98_17010 [Alphaproteobacteria bacterium]|nr:hypothetical protein [Alphaproteobacteria bacterium]
MLRTIAAAKKSGNPSMLLLQALMLLRRTPMGMLEMFLLRKVLAGEGRLFGMDLTSRRQKRWAWLMALLQTHLAKTAAKSGQAAIKRKLLR